MNPRQARIRIRAFQVFAGLSDAVTGCLLVFAPRWTLALMGLRRAPQPIEFASFVGVFVLGVGLAYLLAARRPLNAANQPRWEESWAATALLRSLVAAFLLGEILAARMEAAWLAVALFDGALACVQWAGLSRGWLRLEN